MNKKRIAQFKEGLGAGKYRTVTRETHPFVMSEDIHTCTRCGEYADEEEALYRLVAYFESSDDPDWATVRPLVIVECPKCLAVPERFHDASYSAAVA